MYVVDSRPDRLPVASVPVPVSRPTLLPVQQMAVDRVAAALQGHATVFVGTAPGCGKTLVLDHLHARLGGRMLRVEDALRAYGRRDPAAMEEALIDLIAAAHAEHDIVFFDDLAMASVPSMDADRPAYLDQLLRAYIDTLPDRGKTLVIGWDGRGAMRYGSAFATVAIGRFDAASYRAILEHHAGRALSLVDADEIHRAYRELSGNALAFLGRVVRAEAWCEVTTARLVALAGSYLARTNLDLDEVAPVSLDTLVGIEALVETLERTVLIPMLDPTLARELGLKPKRGVLLHGAPGTGKTTIGRALAQRMRGKFFMIDGTFMPDENFYRKFDRVMTEAVCNSPAVVFIDDADVLFRNGEMIGLARMLLSKLDGLESETQSHVCIVMTAMDIADMPPAMVRSGRVEVWLEMQLPDAGRRVDMIRLFARDLPETLREFDAAAAIAATEGFTPADLRGLVGDARGQFAYDRQRGRPVLSFDAYLLAAAEEIRERGHVLRTVGA